MILGFAAGGVLKWLCDFLPITGSFAVKEAQIKRHLGWTQVLYFLAVIANVVARTCGASDPLWHCLLLTAWFLLVWTFIFFILTRLHWVHKMNDWIKDQPNDRWGVGFLTLSSVYMAGTIFIERHWLLILALVLLGLGIWFAIPERQVREEEPAGALGDPPAQAGAG